MKHKTYFEQYVCNRCKYPCKIKIGCNRKTDLYIATTPRTCPYGMTRVKWEECVK